MTHDDIKAALALAAVAKARARAATRGPWLHVAVTGQTRRSTALNIYTADVQQVIVSDADTLDTAEFIAASRQDVPALADAVRLLADELLTTWAALSDMKSESGMYAIGVRDSLAAVERIDCLHPLMADPLGLLGKSVVLGAVRALLPPCTPA